MKTNISIFSHEKGVSKTCTPALFLADYWQQTIEVYLPRIVSRPLVHVAVFFMWSVMFQFRVLQEIGFTLVPFHLRFFKETYYFKHASFFSCILYPSYGKSSFKLLKFMDNTWNPSERRLQRALFDHHCINL